MTGVEELHILLGGTLVALCLAVGGWGLVRARHVSPSSPVDPGTDPLLEGSELHPASGPPTRGDVIFRQLLALSQTLVLATGAMGLFLLTAEGRPDDPLHTRVYGPFMLVALVAAYGFRTRDVRWNTRVFAVTALVIAALGVRAFVTG